MLLSLKNEKTRDQVTWNSFSGISGSRELCHKLSVAGVKPNHIALLTQEGENKSRGDKWPSVSLNHLKKLSNLISNFM